MNQKINASGSFSWGPNEGAVTSVDVYWLHNSDNPPDWPGANPGVLVSQAAGILYNMNIGSGTGNGDYTHFQVLNGITTDSRIPATKLLSQNSYYYMNAEPLGATSRFFDTNGNPISASAGSFNF